MKEPEVSDLTPAPAAEKPYLSEKIIFSRDIEPYPFIQLWSGVGSGKNTLIENIANGCPEKEFPKKIVLLISSRKSKVTETLNNGNIDISNKLTNSANLNEIWLDERLTFDPYCYSLNRDSDDFFSEVVQRSAICTNAAIECYLKYRYDPSDPTTHPWNRYDMIVWDEAHALVMDSSYQSAPYYVMRLLNETYIRMRSDNPPRCKNIILMTGTPEPLASISMPANAHMLDFRETCRSVSPQNICFLDETKAQQQMKDQLRDGERVVYFGNHVVFPEKLSRQYDMPREAIAVSFSDDDRRANLKRESEEKNEASSDEENDYQRMVNVENYLYEHDSIRPDIALFYTTSRNKEGINIEDQDIRHVYIESHSLTDIRQMAGRFRNGAENVYIILDSKGFGNSEHRYEQVFAKTFCNSGLVGKGISAADELLRNFCAEKKLAQEDAYRTENSPVGDYIDLIKSKSPYIEYDYLTHEFRYNVYREKALHFKAIETQKFNAAAQTPSKLTALFQKEFPNSTIHTYYSPEDEGRAYVEKYLEQHPERFHPYEEIMNIVEHLREVLGAPKRSLKSLDEKITNPNCYLKKVGFRCHRRNKNPAHDNYYFYTLEPCAENEKQMKAMA